MSNDNEASAFGCFVVVAVVILALTFGWAVSGTAMLSDMRREAIERGVARHNPETGYWEWTVDPVKPKAEIEPK